MKIVYVAKHGSGHNDDEGAIAHALRVLGHDVTCIQESEGALARYVEADLCLFHKWLDRNVLTVIDCPKAFWFFDLVEYPRDPTLAWRDARRRQWMANVMPLVDVGFCTDGDWAAKYPDKLVWLPQGFDERLQPAPACEQDTDILFTGATYQCGQGRNAFVAEMKRRWGERFVHVEKGVYREELAKLIARAKIVVAPTEPMTERYWSNRVYLTTGLGGLIVHPGKEHHFMPIEIGLCNGMADLHETIDGYLASPESTLRWFAEHGRDATLEGHLYRHRCEQLIRTVKERTCQTQQTIN